MNDAPKSKGLDPAYLKLFLALGLSMIVMFPLTMAFVDRWSHFYLNLSNFYMAVTMVAPMGIIMLLVMRSMFLDKRINAMLIVAFVLLFFGGLWLGRTEFGIGNEQFLKAMIPHHSRAILVCNNASITDPDIKELCAGIVKTQQEEIDQMEQMLDER